MSGLSCVRNRCLRRRHGVCIVVGEATYCTAARRPTPTPRCRGGFARRSPPAPAALPRAMVHLDKYCSSQLHIDQQANYSAWRRVHGLQIPLHQLQVVGWLLLAFFIGTTFAVLVPALGPSLRSPALFVLACLFFLHCVSHFVALAIDPADYELRVRERAGVRIKPPDFDRTRHAHVIENGLCHICNIRASGPQTKHCRMCNKCVERFDHHCKWLNQCVGARNYVAFLVCVVSAELAALAVFSVCVSELLIYFGNPAFVEALLRDKGGLSGADYRVAQLPLPRYYFLAVLVAQALLAFAAATCLLHLCLFHVYISMRGMTTYEYIRNDAKACSAPTTSTSSATATPTNPAAALSESTTSMPVSLNQSTSSLPVVVSYNTSAYHSSGDCTTRNEVASDVNLLAKRSARDGVNMSVPLWRRLCGCHKSSFVISTVPVPTSKGSVSDARINVRTIDGTRSESALDALYAQEKSGHLRAVGGDDSCRYCRRGKSFGTRGATVANGRVPLKSKCRRRGCRRSVLHRLCCSNASSAKAAADLRSFRSSAEDGFAMGSGHADTLNGCRRNQIKPSAVSARFCDAVVDGGAANVHRGGGRIFITPRRSNSLNSLPALPPPARRHIQSVSLKELNEILAYAQRPQTTANGRGAATLGATLRHPLSSMRRQLRRKSNPQLKPTKTSNLSPIHESGLSNPSTPHLRDRLDRPRELSPLALNSRF